MLFVAKRNKFLVPTTVTVDSHIQELKIHSRHFEEAMKKIRPLSNQELSMYKSISEQFGRPEITGGEKIRKLPEPGLA